jgi:hexosaminidase
MAAACRNTGAAMTSRFSSSRLYGQKMESTAKTTIACLALAFFSSATFAANINTFSIIPLPQKMELRDGVFNLTSGTAVYVDSSSRETAPFLTERLRPSTGYPLKVKTKSRADAAIPGAIFLTTRNASTNLGPEGYELTVTPDSVVIRAPRQAGLFYGVQTLFQLLPPEILSSNRVQNVVWRIPCVEIRDWPRFKWRGILFDVSRHFFSKS